MYESTEQKVFDFFLAEISQTPRWLNFLVKSLGISNLIDLILDCTVTPFTNQSDNDVSFAVKL